QRLAVACNRTLSVYDPTTRQPIEELNGHNGNVKGLAYSPDGRHLAVADLAGVVTLRDAQTHEVVGRRHLDLGKLTAMIWLADSSRLVVGGEKLIAVCTRDELLVVEDAPKPRGEPLSLAGHGRTVSGLSYSRDGRTLVSWTRHSAWRCWDLSG